MTGIPHIFDRPLIAKRLLAKRGQAADFVTRLVLEDLDERLNSVSRAFHKALVLAPDISHLPRQLRKNGDPVETAAIATLPAAPQTPFANPENLSLPADDYDLIISLFDVGITNDVPGFLKQILRHLTPDGLFMAAFVGGTSLNELRAAWLEADSTLMGGAMARIAPFIDTREAGGLLQRAGFALPVADVETHVIRYADPLALMREIKKLGASNPLLERHGKPVTPLHLATACAAYQNAAQDSDKRVRATLEIVWIAGWAPHESQPKPLAPGSAKVRLADVLNKYPLKGD